MTEPHFHGQAGVRIAGTGLGLPEGRLTNADLEKILDTTDEWIVQRTGIRERRKADPNQDSQVGMATRALDAALSDADMQGSDLDLVINGALVWGALLGCLDSVLVVLGASTGRDPFQLPQDAAKINTV